MKRKTILLMTLVLFLPLFFNSNNSVVVEAIQEETNQEKTIYPTAAAVDFTIIDVDSRIAYNLSDFLGKVVIIDCWATWCGPCVYTIPILRDLYNGYYTKDMLQIISVDIDIEESDALVSNFRDVYDMNWIVGIDYNQTIWAEYGNGYIPQFYIVDPLGNIIWDHIGSDMWPEALEKLQLYLPDDTTNPVINQLNVEKSEDEFSIFAPSVNVYANISDDRNVKTANLSVETSSETFYYDLQISKNKDFFIIDEIIEFLPSSVFGETQIDFTLEVLDYWNNTIQSAVKSVDVAQYLDTEAPTIGNTEVEIIEVDEDTFTFVIYSEISDDLMVLEAQIQLIDANDNIVRTKDFNPFNATHMKVTLANLLYVDGQPSEFTFKIIVTDIAGKTSTFTTNVQDTNFVLTMSLLTLIMFGLIVFRKKRR